MGSSITQEQRKKLKKYIEEHPIDPAYDEEYEYLDGKIPEEQCLARIAKEVLDNNPE